MSSRHSYTFAPEKQPNMINMKYRNEEHLFDDFDSFKGFDDAEEDYFDDEEEYRVNHNPLYDFNWEEETWDVMTEGQYGDMPEGFDGDYSFMGY